MNKDASICINCGVSVTPKNSFFNRAPGHYKRADSFEALLGALLCFPFGFHLFGQMTKGLSWIGIHFFFSFITAGIGIFLSVPVMYIDYLLCYQTQRKRKLEPFEFFPRD